MSERRIEEYLWDPGAESAPEVTRIEAALAAARFRGPGRAPEEPRPERAGWGWGAGAALAIAASLALWIELAGGPSYAVDGLAGRERVAAGERLETAGGSATIRVATIGEVVVDPHTRLRVKAIRSDRHELFLERGSVFARIVAAPGLFQIDTPAALTVDMGCEYALSVDADETTSVDVTSGRVTIEAHGRRVWVPAGARCRVERGEAPRSPRWYDTPEPIERALDALEALPAGEPLPAELAPVLARTMDTLALWHLLVAPARSVRDAAFERLAKLHVPPRGVDRAAVEARDEEALERWRGRLQLSWIRSPY